MRRAWITLILCLAAGALIAVIVAEQPESPDEEVVPQRPAPPGCEADARDQNPTNSQVRPKRGGRALLPRRAGHLPIGFNDSAYLVGQLELSQALQLHRAAGSTLWRFPLDWGDVESDPGEFVFDRYDKIYCAATAAGVRPLFHVSGIPTWAAPAGVCSDAYSCVRPPEDEHLDAMRRFSEAAAIRYPRAAAFEAWNEPNLTSFWGGPTDPGGYLKILEAVYVGVKNGNPDVPVLGGALANNPTDVPNGNLSLSTFLRALVDGGGLRHMDAFSLHPYPIEPLGVAGDQFTPALDVARATLAGGEPGVRLWITEIGVPTEDGAFAPAVSPEEQASILSDAYQELDSSDDVDAVLFHTLLDPGPEIPGGPGFGFFLPAADGEPVAKPVVCALHELAGEGPCRAAIAR